MRVIIAEEELVKCAALASMRVHKWGNHHRNYNITLTPQLIRRINRMGVIGEYALAKATRRTFVWDQHWDDIGPDDDVDGVQVRATDRPNGCLIVHDYDPQAPYALVTLSIIGPRCVEATICGWRNWSECIDPLYWRDDVPYPAYFVPQIALHPIDTLQFT